MSKCSRCDEGVGDDLVAVCDICNDAYHANSCSGLSATEIAVLKLKKRSPLFYYKCEKCKDDVKDKTIIQLLTEIRSKVESVDIICEKYQKFESEKLPQIEHNLAQLMQKSNDVDNSISNLQDTVDNLQSQIKDLQTDSGQNTSTPNDFPVQNQATNTNFQIYKEYSNRVSRQKNILLFNLPESADKNESQRQSLDTSKVTEILSKLNINTVLDKNNVKRIGKFVPNKTRPILISMNNRSDASKVIANWQALPRELYVSFDYTLDQRSKYKKLKAVANQFNKEDAESPVYKVVRFNNDGEPFIQTKNKTVKNISKKVD